MDNTIDDKKKKEEFVEYLKNRHDGSYYQAALMAILHKAQEIYGYISVEAIEEISQHLGISTARIWGVVTFYHYFSLEPRGKHIVSVCLGTACYVKGAKRVLNKIMEELGIGLNETTEDGLFTLEAKYCLGCCGLAPVMMIDGKVYEKLTTKKVSEILEHIKNSEQKSFAPAN